MPAVEFESVAKRFGDIRANADVSFRVTAQTIHGLVGENGAGKSTLMNLLYGVYRPDAGQIRLWGRPVHFRGPDDAIAQGVGMVHQHFSLVPSLTALENVALGREPGGAWHIDWQEARRRVDRLLASQHGDVPLDTPVERLDVAVQQRVEILKALYRGARILILDEPTTVVAPEEYERLVSTLRKFVAAGGTVLYISHRLSEIVELCHAVTVMRGGRVVTTGAAAAFTAEALAQAMLGDDVTSPGAPARVGVSGRNVPAIELRNVRARMPGDAPLDDVSLSVFPGEVLGIAGVAGNGQRTLARVFTGLLTPTAGQVLWQGEASWNDVPLRQRRRAGLGWIPADRATEGLVATHCIADNVVLGRHATAPYARFGVRRQAVTLRRAREPVRRFRIQPPDPRTPVGVLSGGNQQKVLVAREVEAKPRLLIAEYPTRGVDVRTAAAVHAALRELRDAGQSVVLFSADLDELLEVSNRIAVLYRGRLVGVLPAHSTTRAELAPLFGGVDAVHANPAATER